MALIGEEGEGGDCQKINHSTTEKLFVHMYINFRVIKSGGIFIP